jgi:hypothetical protein
MTSGYINVWISGVEVFFVVMEGRKVHNLTGMVISCFFLLRMQVFKRPRLGCRAPLRTANQTQASVTTDLVTNVS